MTHKTKPNKLEATKVKAITFAKARCLPKIRLFKNHTTYAITKINKKNLKINHRLNFSTILSANARDMPSTFTISSRLAF